MKIIFCLSYLSVPHTVKLLKNSVFNFAIITSNKELAKFFRLIYPNCVHLIPSFSYRISNIKGLIRLPLTLMQISLNKMKVWNKYKRTKGSEIYFFFNTAAHSHAWLIYKLSKENKILYQEDINHGTWKKANGFFIRVSELFIKLVYKENVYAIDQGDKLVSYKLDKKYLKKICAQRISIELDYKDLSKYLSEKIDLPKGDILMLTNWMPEHRVKKDIHAKASDELISELIKAGYNPHFKMHSRATIKVSLENDLYEVPKYYPASLLLHYKVFIGYITSALFEAANNGLIAISLIEYIPTHDSKRKEEMKKYLNENLFSGKMIYYPKSKEETINIIKTKTNIYV